MDLDMLEPILLIITIDLVLGGDNAVVIALACRHLPDSERKKAIFFGTGLAIGCRIFMTAVAIYLLQIPFLTVIGGILLLYISIQLLNPKEAELSVSGGVSAWQAIRTIVTADIVMGFDNVLAIAGASENRLTYVIFGLLLSVPIIIWGSTLILKVLDRFPLFLYIGTGILAYTSGQLILQNEKVSETVTQIAYGPILFSMFLVVFVLWTGRLLYRTN
ncbi:TerC family protein [Salimicrobium halophilum]|uniref:Integral membrane protein, YjbE family n=1 Tax=Salimicrobium halophilum TaxID=86666 RepID=A0A1G8TTJ9_9BACI|nr:TerC family protein [Salimicrobium halophilum]SDJ44842.1 integral membrane protein, YjbE family [Salimicrobium halophilum]